MKKILIVVAIILVLGAGGFAAGYKILTAKKDISPDSIMPQDMSVVVAIDHSNPDQLKMIEEIFDKIPSTGFFDMLLAQAQSVTVSPFTYEENKNLIKGRWKIVFGVKLPSDPEKLSELLTSPNITLDSNGIEIYLAVKTDDPDRVGFLLNEIAKKSDGEMIAVGTEKDPVWKIKQGTGSVSISRYNDVYFLATTSAQKEAILQRIKDGTGFDQSEEYKTNIKLLGEKNLGYTFVNQKAIYPLWKEMWAPLYDNFPSDLMDVGNNNWGVLIADKDGVKMRAKMYFSDDKTLADKYYPVYELSLIKKVPSTGVIFYLESPGFGTIMKTSLGSVNLNINGGSSFTNDVVSEMINKIALPEDADVANEFPPLEEENSRPDELSQNNAQRISREIGYKSEPVVDGVVEPDLSDEVPMAILAEEKPVFDDEYSSQPLSGLDLYDESLNGLATFSGLTKDEVSAILDNPFAFSFSDVGGYLPTFTFYLQLKPEVIENAKKLLIGMADYADKVLQDLDVLLAGQGFTGVVKKEVKIVDGVGIQRIYLDWTAVPAEKILMFNLGSGIDVSKIKVELYFGILNDGNFVVAFYPDFIDAYGKDTIYDAGYYKEMLSRAGDLHGHTLFFMRMSPIVDLFDRYFEIGKKLQGITDEDTDALLNYEMYTKLARAFKYLFMMNSRDETGLLGDFSIAIDEVEFSPELMKKIEADKLAKKQALEAQQKAFEEMMSNPEKDEVIPAQE